MNDIWGLLAPRVLHTRLTMLGSVKAHIQSFTSASRSVTQCQVVSQVCLLSQSRGARPRRGVRFVGEKRDGRRRSQRDH